MHYSQWGDTQVLIKQWFQPVTKRSRKKGSSIPRNRVKVWVNQSEGVTPRVLAYEGPE